MMQRVRGCAGVTIGLGAMLWLMLRYGRRKRRRRTKPRSRPARPSTPHIARPATATDLVSTGQFPNLRRLTAKDRAKFDTTVRNGRNQMPPWKDVLSDEQIDQLWSYIRANAYEK